MRILYIVTQADGGGAQKYVLTLAKHFGGIIAAGREGEELFKEGQGLGLTCYRLKNLQRNINPIRDILALFEIIRLIRKVQPDLIHLNSSKAGFFGGVAGKLLGKKTIFTAHGFFYFTRANWWIRQSYKLSERLASLFWDSIITVSQRDASLAQQYLNTKPEKLKIIYNGIKPLVFEAREEAKKQFAIRNDEIVCCTIAHYYHRKGFDILITAVAQLPSDVFENLKVILIGEGPEKNKLLKIIKDKKLDNTITLKGSTPQASKLMKAFDLFILPSRREGFPFVLLEAMQAGLPIIATDVGGNKEALADAGILIPPENPEILAQAISTLIRDESLRHKLSEKAKQRSAVFTEDKMLQKTKEIYDQFLID